MASSRIVLLNALLNQRKEEGERQNLIGKMKECAVCTINATADSVPPGTFANLKDLWLPDEVRQLLEKSVPATTQATLNNWPEDGALFIRT